MVPTSNYVSKRIQKQSITIFSTILLKNRAKIGGKKVCNWWMDTENVTICVNKKYIRWTVLYNNYIKENLVTSYTIDGPLEHYPKGISQLQDKYSVRFTCCI